MWQSYLTESKKCQRIYFQGSRLNNFKEGRKKPISWAGLGQRGKEDGHPWWRNYRQFGCRVVWSNIFVKVFKHERSRIVGDTKLDAFGFKLCSLKIVFGNYIPLRKIYKWNGYPKHKNVLTNLCIFKSVPNRIFPLPLPLITCLQEYPPRNIFLKFYHERVYLVWVRDLKILWKQVPSACHVKFATFLGSIKYSYLCNCVLYNPHSFIFPWLTG